MDLSPSCSGADAAGFRKDADRSLEYFWEIEENPHSSKVERKTEYSPGNWGVLRDNCVWQCFAVNKT